MNSGDEFLKAATAINVDYWQNEDGTFDFENANLVPTPWDEWVKLPIRPFDDALHTTKLVVRVPTVIVCVHYAKMPKKKRHVSKKGIRERDGSRCQVTGRVLSKHEGNVDHLVPRSRGGKDTWENMVWMDKDLNSKKGDKTLDEMGWQLIKKPSAPREIPVSETITELEHTDWRFFMDAQ